MKLSDELTNALRAIPTQTPLGTREQADLKKILNNHRFRYHLLMGVLIAALVAVIVLPLVLPEVTAQIGTAAVGGLTGSVCLYHLSRVVRESLAIELLVRLAKDDPDAGKALLAVLKKWASADIDAPSPTAEAGKHG